MKDTTRKGLRDSLNFSLSRAVPIFVALVAAGCQHSPERIADHHPHQVEGQAKLASKAAARLAGGGCTADSRRLQKIDGTTWNVIKVDTGVPGQHYEAKSKFSFTYSSGSKKITNVFYNRWIKKSKGHEGKKNRNAKNICSTNFGNDGVQITYDFKSKDNAGNEHAHFATFTFTKLSQLPPIFRYDITDSGKAYVGANGHGKGSGTGD